MAESRQGKQLGCRATRPQIHCVICDNMREN